MLCCKSEVSSSGDVHQPAHGTVPLRACEEDLLDFKMGPLPQTPAAFEPHAALAVLRQQQQALRDYVQSMDVWIAQQEEALKALAPSPELLGKVFLSSGSAAGAPGRREADGHSAPVPSLPLVQVAPVAGPQEVDCTSGLEVAAPAASATAASAPLSQVAPTAPAEATQANCGGVGGDHEASAPHSGSNWFSQSEEHKMAGRCSVVVQSRWFKLLSATVVLANAIAVGWEVQYHALQPLDWMDGHRRLGAAVVTTTVAAADPVVGTTTAYAAHSEHGNVNLEGFKVAEIVFSCFYVIEFCIKLWAFRKNLRVNWKTLVLDFILTAGAVVEFIVSLSLGQAEPALMFFRVIRLARLAQLGEVAQWCRELNIIAMSLWYTLKLLFWVLIIIFVVIYVFAIMITSATTNHLEAFGLGQEPDYAHHMYEEWGTLPRSIYTLFKCMVEGVHWGEPAGILLHLDWIYFAIFLCYIMFTKLTMLEVMLGFFAESAFAAVKQDAEEIVHEQMKNKDKHVKEFKRIFAALDEDNSGDLTFQELEHHMHDPEFQAYFASLSIDVSKANTVFALIDDDNSGRLTVDEFVDGCLRLRGQATMVDVAKIQSDVCKLLTLKGRNSAFDADEKLKQS